MNKWEPAYRQANFRHSTDIKRHIWSEIPDIYSADLIVTLVIL
jgi:hypothetical protein